MPNEMTNRPANRHEAMPLTLRDALMPVFRQRRLASFIFIGVLTGSIAGGLLLPRKYEAEMKILVNRDRVDTVVTPNPDAAEMVAPVPAVSEQDINSEVELLRSRDLLENVAMSSGLATQHRSRWSRFAEQTADVLRGTRANSETRLARTAQTLNNGLVVEPLKKTTMIRVAYTSHDPQLSARVLQTLSALYQEKHAAVHRPVGAFTFFEQQADRYRNELASAEMQLTDFNGQQNVVAPAAQKQLVIEQLSQFEAELQKDQASADAAHAKVQALRAQAVAAPERQTTQIRKLDNAQLLAQLEGDLLSLELKRSEMLSKYAPAYTPVRDVETQIDEARAALAHARQTPVEDITTDRVPAQDWMATEIAKTQSERAEMESQTADVARTVRRYQAAALELDRNSRQQDDLVRKVKTAEDNYLLYLRKREEARISDALDSQRIVNVSIAEQPTVPALPTLQLGWVLMGGFFTASLLSVGGAYAADRMDSSFRTPDELTRYLDLKVLASIPASTARA